VVGIALLTLVPGALGGSESSTRALLAELARSGTLDYRVYLPPVAPDAGEGLPALVVDGYRPAQTLPERLAAMTLAAARPARLRAAFAGAEVVHYPLTIRLPSLELPSVVTLHDLQHLDLPELFSRAERAFRALAYHRSVRTAARVVCPSEFVAGRAVTLLGLDRATIRVIPHGIDHARFTPGLEAREPFLLYPARNWPHKNHALLFDAFARLRASRPELRLVLTGGGGYPSLPEGVEARGLVSAEELVSLYRRAAALVFPSRYEGFGQPPLEAMACGCPVACSNAASLPEICADAACYFAPDDAAGAAAAIERVLADPAPWVEAGRRRAAEFTWTRSAAAYEAVYAELL
jgi:glycosyltransferase involved in cell wall biosynthesis